MSPPYISKQLPTNTTMRNVKVLNRSSIKPESLTAPDLSVIDTCFDLISDSLTIALSGDEQDIIEIQQFEKNGNIKILASIPTSNGGGKLLSLAHFEESSQIILILSNGDIILCTYDSISNDFEQSMIEIVGTIDCGIKSAKWSYDEEILALVTNEHNLLLFSRNLDLILEKKIDPQDLKFDNNHVSLGWGKEETQFKGKGAKQLERERKILQNAGLNIDSDNAILCDPTIKILQNGEISKFDLQEYEISWRGDCQFFAITCIEDVPGKDASRRVIRVYSRDGDLISVSEPIDGQEHTLAWKPQGSLIASTQRRFEPELNDNVLDVIFFEKNGLRHGEFDSRLNANLQADNIVKIDWSSNSEILLLQLHKSVQLWYTKNYHWYLKQEIPLIDEDDEITFTKFHPEKPFKLMIGTTSGIQIVDMAYTNTRGNTIMPNDSGSNLVIDGNNCMLTPFKKANVPPPVAYRDLYVDEPITSAAISKDNLHIVALTNKKVYLFKQQDKDELDWNFEQVSEFSLQGGIYTRQIAFVSNGVYILFDEMNMSNIMRLILEGDELMMDDVIEIPTSKIITLSSNVSFDYVSYELINGTVNIIDETNSIVEVGKFPQLCTEFQIVEVTTEEEEVVLKLPIGLMPSGKMYVNDKLISQGVTSMLLTDAYLLFTTAQHQLQFIHLLNNPLFYNDEQFKELKDDINQTSQTTNGHDERVRTVERGSLLVNSIPSKSSVILQAPRGNLETIYPRIMVLNDVRKDIKARNYKNAFSTCRIHRISLDILHDYDPDLFFANVSNFVSQLEKVEYLDLFLSCLLEENVCQTKYRESGNVNATNEPVSSLTADLKDLKFKEREKGTEKVRKICDAILDVLVNNPQYKEKYLQSIITAYASQKPPRTEEALQLIATFEDDSKVETSVQHLCFLLDVNKLYNIALSIYNIPLALVVAQQSQKDPKEYLPFLQSLYEETELRRRVMVDTYLKQYEKALESLVKIPVEEGKDVQDEIIDFIIDHELYKHALKLYRYDEKNFNLILKFFASYLHSTQKYTQSAIIYEKLAELENALENYILGKNWREAISITLKSEFSHELEKTCTTLVDSLTLIHDYKSAAYISFKYLKNLRSALELYGKEYEYSTAIQLALEEGQPELIKEVIDPSIAEGFGTIAELLADCSGQIDSQIRRLRELREKKEQDPYAFYGETGDNDNTADNVSIAPSEASTKESFFTRYTGKTGGTAQTGASRRTAKNKRREERKRARGKKGTIYEEEYLISSIGRLIDRLETTKPDAVKLLQAMVRRNMVEQAYLVQSKYTSVLQLLKDNVVEIYTVDKRDRERLDENGCIYYADEIPVPTIKDFPALDVLDY